MIRPPAVAGQFYPGTPQRLNAMIESLTPSPTVAKMPALAIVAPHAGYVYSGSVAAQTFARAMIPETAVIFGPNHHGMGDRLAVMTHGTWQLPGAAVDIDTALAMSLIEESPLYSDDSLAHRYEHSLEVQVPFLIHHGVKKIVPVCASFLPFAVCREAGEALARAIQNARTPTVIVASTDMTHYESRDVASRKDSLAIKRIEALDPEGLYHTVTDNRISMCGIIPTTIALVACRHLGATKATLIRYTDSGEASGDTDRVVGYAGFVVL